MLNDRVRCRQTAVCMGVPLRAGPAMEIDDLLQRIICDRNACHPHRNMGMSA